MDAVDYIEISYEATNDATTAKAWLNSLPEVFAADFEAAVRYTKEEIEAAKLIAEDTSVPKIERVEAQSIAKANALGHPYHCTITHCSIAYSEKDAYVFIIDNKAIADEVLDFLVSTTRTQIWHNYSYDGRLIRYYADNDAINVEDTQIYAKTLINHVDTFKAKTRLKDLMGDFYGDWAISADNFTIEQQHEEHVLKYAAIDACATFKLWEYLNNFVEENNT